MIKQILYTKNIFSCLIIDTSAMIVSRHNKPFLTRRETFFKIKKKTYPIFSTWDYEELKISSIYCQRSSRITFIIILSDTENLALKKPTWQEHPWPDPRRDFGSENAVDGLYYDRRARSGQCTINDDGYYTAEWRVDLGSASSISHINIYYRTDNESL